MTEVRRAMANEMNVKRWNFAVENTMTCPGKSTLGETACATASRPRVLRQGSRGKQLQEDTNRRDFVEPLGAPINRKSSLGSLSSAHRQQSRSSTKRTTSDSFLVGFGHSQRRPSKRNATWLPPQCNQDSTAETLESSSTGSPGNSSSSLGAGLRTYLTQIVAEKKETNRHSAIEKGLMQQLAICRQQHKSTAEELILKLRQRDEAIAALEKAVMIKNETIDTLRDEMERNQRREEAEKQLLKEELEALKKKYRKQKRRNSDEVKEMR